MALIEIEKNTGPKEQVPNPRPYSNSVYVNDTLNSLNNAGSETYVFETQEEKRINNNLTNSAGMNGNRLQKEGSLIAMSLTTLVFSFFTIALIVALFYLVFDAFGDKIEIFPYQSNYTVEEFNSYLKRSFIILFGIVSFLSIASMLIVNNIIRARFEYYYLSKFKIFIYDVIVVIQNILLYIFEMWFMFQIVNNIHNDFVIWKTNGTILGDVNIETIEIFKYVIVIIMTIFIVLNSFSSIDIIHQKNKFVLDEQI